MQFGLIPPELRALRQWVVWRKDWLEDQERWNKPLINPHTGLPARTHDREEPDRPYTDKASDTWGSYQEAATAYRQAKGAYAGVGFVFTENDPYVGIDLDKCVVNGKIQSTEAKAIILALNSYTEWSQSKSGVHVIVRGDLPPGGRRKGGIEMYDQGRYFAMTGDLVPKCLSTIEDRQEELDEIHRMIFGEKPVYATVVVRPKKADIDVLEKARNAANGTKFRALYDYGDVSLYGGDDSSADLALCGILAFWTQGDEGKIDFLFRSSALFRPKWERNDYRCRTIRKALDGKTQFYDPNHNGNGKSHYRPAMPLQEETEDKRFNLTEFGDSERLAHEHGEDLRYSSERQVWYVWNGQQWIAENGYGRLIDRAKATIRAIGSEAIQIQEPEERSKWLKHAAQSEKAAHVKNMEFLARAIPDLTITNGMLDTDPLLFNCPNGTLNLRNGQLLEHKRVDLITMMSGTEYQEDSQSPLWQKFLERILPDEEIRLFFQRACGYALTGDTSEQCFFFLHGSGANGKSTAINALLKLAGDYGQQSVSDLLLTKKSDTVRPEIAQLNKKRLVATIEIDDGRRMAEGLVKQMTGGEDIRARLLYEGFFQFTPTHKVFMAANHKPVIRGTDLAIWRRVMLVPFDETIREEEKDPKLGHKLATEMAGILRWCVEGCLEWQRIGLAPPNAVIAAVTTYRTEQDIVGRFLADKCIDDPFSSINSGRLYHCYTEWCKANGERETSNTMFGRELTSKGYEPTKKSGVAYRLGLSFPGESINYSE